MLALCSRLYLSPEALAPLLGYLRRLGAAPHAPAAVPAEPAEELLDRMPARVGIPVRIGLGHSVIDGEGLLWDSVIAGVFAGSGTERRAKTTRRRHAW
jgi:hypothetical protein